MPLRSVIAASPETLTEIVLAAEDRYADAEELLLQHRFDGSIYLLGYASEMWLKATCLHLRGFGAASEVKSALPALRKWMGVVMPRVPFRDYHDLSFWAECVLQLRASVRRPVSTALDGGLRDHIVSGLHESWAVEMRYRRCGSTAADAFAVLAQAWWLKRNWLELI